MFTSAAGAGQHSQLASAIVHSAGLVAFFATMSALYAVPRTRALALAESKAMCARLGLGIGRRAAPFLVRQGAADREVWVLGNDDDTSAKGLFDFSSRYVLTCKSAKRHWLNVLMLTLGDTRDEASARLKRWAPKALNVLLSGTDKTSFGNDDLVAGSRAVMRKLTQRMLQRQAVHGGLATAPLLLISGYLGGILAQFQFRAHLVRRNVYVRAADLGNHFADHDVAHTVPNPALFGPGYNLHSNTIPAFYTGEYVGRLVFKRRATGDVVGTLIYIVVGHGGGMCCGAHARLAQARRVADACDAQLLRANRFESDRRDRHRLAAAEEEADDDRAARTEAAAVGGGEWNEEREHCAASEQSERNARR